MTTLFVNLDKKQYFRQRAFEGKESRYHYSTEADYKEALFALGRFLGSEGNYGPDPRSPRFYLGCWQAERIAILHGADEENKLIPEEQLAFESLAHHRRPCTSTSGLRTKTSPGPPWRWREPPLLN